MFPRSKTFLLCAVVVACLGTFQLGCAADTDVQDVSGGESENDLTQRAQSAALLMVYGTATASPASAPVTWRRDQASADRDAIQQVTFERLPTRVSGGRTDWALSAGTKQNLTYSLTTARGTERGQAMLNGSAGNTSIVFVRNEGTDDLKLNVSLSTNGAAMYLGAGVPDIKFVR